MDEILKNLSEHTGISVETARNALGRSEFRLGGAKDNLHD